MKLILFVLSATICFSFSIASEKQTYTELLQKKDFEALILHLQEWEKISPDDPELAIAYFNYYVFRNYSNGIAIKPGTPDDKTKDTLNLTDSHTGKQAGYFTEETFYDENDVIKGISYLDKALKKHPDRLDIHFGKVHALSQIKYYDKQSEAIIETLPVSRKIENKWLWHEGNPYPGDAEKFYLNEIQGRIYFFHQINRPDLIEKTASAAIKYYPDNLYFINDLGGVYFEKKDFPKALEYFKKAEKIAPNDIIVLYNIAYLFDKTGNETDAENYYAKVASLDGGNLGRIAAKRCNEIKNLKSDKK